MNVLDTRLHACVQGFSRVPSRVDPLLECGQLP